MIPVSTLPGIKGPRGYFGICAKSPGSGRAGDSVGVGRFLWAGLPLKEGGTPITAPPYTAVGCDFV